MLDLLKVFWVTWYVCFFFCHFCPVQFGQNPSLLLKSAVLCNVYVCVCVLQMLQDVIYIYIYGFEQDSPNLNGMNLFGVQHFRAISHPVFFWDPRGCRVPCRNQTISTGINGR